MAGILNSKERLIDFIITPQGRRQMVDGRMRIEFATLTDQHTFYSTTHPDRVADDASTRIFFETHTSTTDTIVPELDAGGAGTILQPFRAGSFLIDGKTFASGTYTTSTGSYYQILSGSDILGRSVQLSESLVKHFEGLRILSTEDQFSNSSDFQISAITGSFLITDQDLGLNQGKGIYLKDLTPGDTQTDGTVFLKNSPSIYTDPRLGHLPNYKWLPPRNLPQEGQHPDDVKLRLSENYPDFSKQSSTPPGTQESSEKFIDSLISRQSVAFEFTDTSIENNLVGQMFEFSKSGVDKLSIIDYGIHNDLNQTITDNPSSVDSNPKHVFFLGKILTDEEEVQTFMNIFTLVFDNKE